MKSALYSYLQEDSVSNEILAPELFQDETAWDNLQEQERKQFFILFLQKAEALLHGSEINEDQLAELFLFIEKVEGPYPDLLCRLAVLFYEWGQVQQQSRFYILALHKLQIAKTIDPGLFNAFFEWVHLWGNILLALAEHSPEEGLIERGLEKFQAAANVLMKSPSALVQMRELYWDWANGWFLLGKRSNELIDLLESMKKFHEASEYGCDLPHFRIDYGEVLLHVGLRQGDPSLLRSASEHFKEAVSTCLLLQHSDSFPKAAFKKAWCALVTTALKLAEMTGSESDFKAADHLIHEAILALPSQGDFWLDWGALYLAHGWIHKTPQSVEAALEKLTSSKISSCDPIQVSALLGEGLVLLGLFLEDFRLLKEGETRLIERLKFAPEDAALLYARGLASLGLGLYFSDEKYFQEAVEWFQKGLKFKPSYPKLWQGLYQSYMTWGTTLDNEWIIRKGLAAMERLVELRPLSPHHWCQWGVGYLRLYQLEKYDIALLEESVCKLKKAIDLRPGEEEPDWLFYYACGLDLMGEYYQDEKYYEQAIGLFSQVLEKVPHAINVQYQLALCLSHYGEAVGDISSLHQAHDLFQSVIKPDEDEDRSWEQWGYALLVLSTLVADAVYSSEGENFRSLAEAKLMRAVELGSFVAHYHLACLYSLSAMFEQAIKSLERLDAAGELPPIEDLEQDEWLEGLRQTPLFLEFMNTLGSQHE